MKRITEIANKIGIDEEYIESYGKYKAKISNEYYDKIKDNADGKLILVTSINPTPLGEGKTTTSIGLTDGLSKLAKKSILALREPSLGPVFGIKGGATGGGKSQLFPMEDINLQFTGDIPAITSANNLLSAMIDNHIFQGNELNIKKVTWNRCVDLNDRALREVKTGLSDSKMERNESFDITAASEIMAILCLSSDMNDLKRRLGNIVIGYNSEGNKIRCKDLKAEGSMAVILKDAIKPNLVQTLEENPVLVHGGPFANIAHGCNSVIATKMALKMADYVVTEAGFGADLGAEKFINIKCRKLEKSPDAVVIVSTIRALKYRALADKEMAKEPNLEAVKIGINNLKKHIENIKEFGINVVVAINKFDNDQQDEIEFVKEEISKQCEICVLECFENGSDGAIDLASKVVNLCEKEHNLKYTYDLADDIKTKIEKITTKIYGAENVEYTTEASEQIEKLNQDGNAKIAPICMAKTQYSFSDDAKNLLCDKLFNIHIKNVEYKEGAEFIVAKTGDIMTMPGLPKKPAAEEISINDDGKITGIF